MTASAPQRPPAAADASVPVTILRPLPRIHYCCFIGDLCGVLECITEGQSIHDALSMYNRHNQTVCGITPLFLAAQRGHTKVCKLLVENGANPNQPSYIQGTTELCTPAEVAQLNMHLMLARYLRKAVKHRLREDAVLTQDEQDTERARQASDGAPGAPAQVFMANLSDLTNWDPATGTAIRLEGAKVKKLMDKNKLDLYSWKPEDDMPASSSHKVLNPSQSRVLVDPVEDDAVETLDNNKMLSAYLKDLDLQEWDPQQAGTSHGHRSMGDGRGAGLGSFRGLRSTSVRRGASGSLSAADAGDASSVGDWSASQGDPAEERSSNRRKAPNGRWPASWRAVGGLWRKVRGAGQQDEEAAAASASGSQAVRSRDTAEAAEAVSIADVRSTTAEHLDAELEVSASRAAYPEDDELDELDKGRHL